MPIQTDYTDPAKAGVSINNVTGATSTSTLTLNDTVQFIIADPDDALGFSTLVNASNLTKEQLGLSLVGYNDNRSFGGPVLQEQSFVSSLSPSNLSLTTNANGDYVISMKISNTKEIYSGMPTYYDAATNTSTPIQYFSLKIEKNGYSIDSSTTPNTEGNFRFGAYNLGVKALIASNPTLRFIGINESSSGASGFASSMINTVDSSLSYYGLANNSSALSRTAISDVHGNKILNASEQSNFFINNKDDGVLTRNIKINATKDQTGFLKYGSKAAIKIAADQLNVNSNYKPGAIKKVSVAGKDIFDATITTSADAVAGKINVTLAGDLNGSGYAFSDQNLIYKNSIDNTQDLIKTNSKVKIIGGAKNDAMEIANSSVSGVKALSGGAGDDTLVLNGNGVVGIGGGGADTIILGAKAGDVQHVVISINGNSSQSASPTAIAQSAFETGIDTIYNFNMFEDKIWIKYIDNGGSLVPAMYSTTYNATTGISNVVINSQMGSYLGEFNVAAFAPMGESIEFNQNLIENVTSSTVGLPDFVDATATHFA